MADDYSSYASDGPMAPRAASWQRSDTVDAWRHRRMYATLDPLLETRPGATWLTVGDGRYASDARYLHEQGASVLATDISDTLLNEAVTTHWVPAAQREDAERLSFPDRSFDFVLCKESFHHLRRPMVGLYEMLRVARHGVALIEPADRFEADSIPQVALRAVARLRRLILGKPVGRFAFEPTGNYQYDLSAREVEKVAAGLGLAAVAFKRLNDHFVEGVAEEPADASSRMFKMIRGQIAVKDALTRIGLYKPTLLVALILVEMPDEAIDRALRVAGFSITRIPANPYQSAESDL